MEKILKFYSPGKLLISGEYAVLDGAKALALPTQLGQWLEVSTSVTEGVEWTAFDVDGNPWFSDVFSVKDFTPTKHEHSISKNLCALLRAVRAQQPEFLVNSKGVKVETKLEFHTHWGLGSSSTLVNNVAQWAQADAYVLQEKVFGGSGYDIGCAQSSSPIVFQRVANQAVVKHVDFWPDFHKNLFFVYLNKKQNSRSAIKSHYKGATTTQVESINKLTETLLNAKCLEDFQKSMQAHESLIGKLLGQTPVQQRLFSDYPGVIKSLGAWGGDFVLACGFENSTDYFFEKGHTTVLPFEKIISKKS